MKLKPLLFVAGAAGAIAAVVKSRGEQVTQAAGAAAAAAPQPVKDAAQKATETVQDVVDKVTPGDSSAGDQPKERYEPPIEAGAQPPAEAGGAPSDATKVHETPRIESLPGDQLNTPEHDPPGDAVMPDTSADDTLVQQQINAAEADAGSIGGNVDDMAAEDASFPTDPAERPVVEGSGDEVEEAFEAREDIERSNREID
jgi:hypothetical protein